MKYKVTFTFWDDDKDIRTLIANNCHELQGMLVAIHENNNIELLNVENVSDEKITEITNLYQKVLDAFKKDNK